VRLARVVFFEKPGCANNARQKAWLTAAGHVVDARDLLHHAWSREELLSYLGELPVTAWFNPAAPQVKSGHIQPALVEREAALRLLLSEPLLIRRPLLCADGRREVGFDIARIHAWLGLPEAVVAGLSHRDVERCARNSAEANR